MTPGGVGYAALLSVGACALAQPGSEITLQTYLVVREDALELFGFNSSEEKTLFELFLLVNGVGPKTALHLLALGSVSEIKNAIGRGDVSYLTKVSGIGAKTAERIVVELRSKMKDHSLTNSSEKSSPTSDAVSDVIDGLEALGYSSIEARDIVKVLDAAGKTSEQLLREALRKMK